MKNIANRMIVFTASMIAFGTVAFGQTAAVAEIPFGFHTTNGTLPAGTYKFKRVSTGGTPTAMVVQNTTSGESHMAGIPRWEPATNGQTLKPHVEFACAGSDCTLKSITTSEGRLVYTAPHKPASASRYEELATVSVPFKKAGE